MKEHEFRLLLSIDGDLYAIERTGPAAWRIARERAAGRDYTVTSLPSGFCRCTCRGFAFRGACKHISGLRSMNLVGSPPVAQPQGA